ncbi:MAG: hypothetical protein BWY76_00412 [bacterium ADurb.Bin429]|nr:MAG: hypothetical protein BWY76_00412 [bacterium ADurb.Bin429]
MNTAQALENMTDRGRFELLVTSVLRNSKPEYEAIMDLGTNAEGETVRSPLDGFCCVPGSSPPRYILVEHTTIERDKLARKWLAVPQRRQQEPGDLVKALHEADEIRQAVPNALFTVVLSTNKRPPQAVTKEAFRLAAVAGVALDIWEQSRIAGYLDNKPDGHWLRKHYLGIDAEMLSFPLLRQLSRDSLQAYQHELLSSPDTWIPRDIAYGIEGKGAPGNARICLLIGESGFGKSTEAYLLLQRHVAAGGVGLWIPAEILDDAVSLHDAVKQVLLRLCPSLLPNAGQRAFSLLPTDQPLMLVIDDINRVNLPSRILRRLLAWMQPRVTTEAAKQGIGEAPFLVVTPLWPKVWGEFSHSNENQPWIETVYIGAMSTAEGTAAVHHCVTQTGKDITPAEAAVLAQKMGNDPILIGLFGKLLTVPHHDAMAVLAENVLERYLRMMADELVQHEGETIFAHEYLDALSALAREMLLHRCVHPTWHEIDEWLLQSPALLRSLRKLVQHGNLCRLSSRAQFEFRHDRILYYYIAQAILAVLNAGNLDCEPIWDPYFNDALGEALVKFHGEPSLLDSVCEHAPIALFKAIQAIGSNPRTSFHKAILSAAHAWAASTVATKLIPEAVITIAAWTMMETDADAILDISQHFNMQSHLIQLARLRNGCAASGAAYCTNGIHAASASHEFDELLDQARHHHKEQLRREMKALLSDSAIDDTLRYGLLSLAGLLGDDHLKDGIRTCWANAQEKDEMLAVTIWAAARCCGDTPNLILDPLMAYWAAMSGEEDEGGMSDRTRVADRLEFAFIRGISDIVLQYLIHFGDVHESLRWPIALMLEHYDNPQAFDFVIREAAAIAAHDKEKGRFSPWVASLTDKWCDAPHGFHRISQTSRRYLQAAWLETTRPVKEREIAFRFWLTGLMPHDIELLRSIPADSPLATQVVWARVRLGDTSVIPELLTILPNMRYRLDCVYPVWCDAIREEVERYMTTLVEHAPKQYSRGGGAFGNDGYHLASLLCLIPASDAEALLDAHWESLQYSPLFIQTAVLIGTPRCHVLAAESIKDYPEEVPVFEHVMMRMNKRLNGQTIRMQPEHLERLLPFARYLGERELYYMADTCQRLGIPEWSKEHLYPYLSDNDRRRFHPTDDDLFAQLDAYAEDKDNSKYHHLVWAVEHIWLAAMEKQNMPREQILSIMQRWLERDTTIERFRVAAACVQAIGKREDLTMLERCLTTCNSQVAAEILQSTRFMVYRRTLG